MFYNWLIWWQAEIYWIEFWPRGGDLVRFLTSGGFIEVPCEYEKNNSDSSHWKIMFLLRLQPFEFGELCFLVGLHVTKPLKINTLVLYKVLGAKFHPNKIWISCQIN